MGLPLSQAEQWLKTRRAEIDPPEQRFIEESTRADRLRRRSQRVAVAVAFVLISAVAAIAGVAYFQERKAEAETRRQSDIATSAYKQSAEAEAVATRQKEQAQFTESGLLANVSGERIKESDFGSALLLAIEALPDAARGLMRPYVPAAEVQADSAIRETRERAVLAGHEDVVMMSSFRPRRPVGW